MNEMNTKLRYVLVLFQLLGGLCLKLKWW